MLNALDLLTEPFTLDGIPPKLAIGTRLREIREARDLTQRQVARLLGLTQITLSRIERGQREMEPAILEHYRRLFGVSREAFPEFRHGYQGKAPDDAE